MTAYVVTARNFSAKSDNRIHSDEIARQMGFEGALVPGVAVFGHLTYPLAERFGHAWLAASASTARFMKPAYHGNRLTVTLDDTPGELTARCTARDVQLAELVSRPDDPLPEPEDQRILDAPCRDGERVEISWDNITVDEPFRPWTLRLDPATNQRYTEQISDPLNLYTVAVHPHWLLSLANAALVNEYVMPAWLHVGSDIVFRELVKVGDELSVRAVPVEKWRNKGHEFVRVYIAYYRGDRLTTEVRHTAIYRIAGA